MTDLDLAAIRARADAATGGPWAYHEAFEVVYPDIDGRRAEWIIDYTKLPADAEFVAHARTDIPALLDALAARDAVIANQTRLLAKIHDDAHTSDEVEAAIEEMLAQSPATAALDMRGHWSNGDPVHLTLDGKGGRRVAPNLNGAEWVSA